MPRMDANKIINDLGGTAEVARLCGVRPPSVSEWRINGVPAARLMYLQLLRPDVFKVEDKKPAEPEATYTGPDKRLGITEPGQIMPRKRSTNGDV